MLRNVLLIIVVSMLAAAIPAVEPPPDSDGWTRLGTGQFEIFTDAGEQEAHELARTVDQMMTAIGHTTDFRLESPRPVRVFAFRTSESFRPFRDALVGPGTDKTGVFATTNFTNYILLDGSMKRFRQMMQHELTHLFIRNSFDTVPLWVNEGLAEFYETLGVQGERLVIGSPDPPTVQLLRRERFIPIRDILELTGSAEEFRSGHRASMIYAQSWAMIHYLLVARTDGQDQLRHYLTLLLEGHHQSEAFDRAFGRSPEELEKEVSAYARRGNFLQVAVESAGTNAQDWQPLPVTRSTQLAELGTLLLDGGGDHESAGLLLEEAILLDQQNSRAHSSLGMVLESKGELSSAFDAYQRALAIDPADPRAGARLPGLPSRPLAVVVQSGGETTLRTSTDEATRKPVRRHPRIPAPPPTQDEVRMVVMSTRDSFSRLSALYYEAIELANTDRTTDALELLDLLLEEAREGGLFHEAANDLRSKIVEQRRLRGLP